MRHTHRRNDAPLGRRRMKSPLLLLCSVSGLCCWFPLQHGHCSEQTHTHTLTTRAVSHQPVIDGSDEQNIFISDVESSSRITDIVPVSSAPHVCGPSECVSCRSEFIQTPQCCVLVLTGYCTWRLVLVTRVLYFFSKVCCGDSSDITADVRIITEKVHRSYLHSH